MVVNADGGGDRRAANGAPAGAVMAVASCKRSGPELYSFDRLDTDGVLLGGVETPLYQGPVPFHATSKIPRPPWRRFRSHKN